jgi:hypothetical protein
VGSLCSFDLLFFRERARLDALQRARVICDVESDATTLATREPVWAQLCLQADEHCPHHTHAVSTPAGGLRIQAEESPTTTWILLLFIVATGGARFVAVKNQGAHPAARFSLTSLGRTWLGLAGGLGVVGYRAAMKSMGKSDHLVPTQWLTASGRMSIFGTSAGLDTRLSRLERKISDSSGRLLKLKTWFTNFQGVVIPNPFQPTVVVPDTEGVEFAAE